MPHDKDPPIPPCPPFCGGTLRNANLNVRTASDYLRHTAAEVRKLEGGNAWVAISSELDALATTLDGASARIIRLARKADEE